MPRSSSFLIERGLGEAVGRLGVVALHRDAVDAHRRALAQRRQDALLVGQLGLGVVGAFDVGAAKTRELDAQTRRGESDLDVARRSHSPRPGRQRSRTRSWVSRASTICEAIVRFQIRS